MDACKAYKEDPSDANKDALMSTLIPVKREKYSEHLLIDDSTGDLYFADTEVPIPSELTELIKDYVDNDLPIDPLVNFWLNCLDNPSKEARDGFFKYIKDFGIVITDYGYALLYKAVNKSTIDGQVDRHKTDSSNATLSQFVSAEFLKIKKWKKSPKNYDVYGITTPESNKVEYSLSTHTGESPTVESNQIVRKIGNLHKMNQGAKEASKDLEVSTEKVTVYRPGHTGTHGMEIKLGTPVTMPRDKCDPNIKIDCSYGLHVGSHKYVSSFGRGMGSILAVLVNPADVVALPEYDHSKIRVCRYFPYAEIERKDDGSWEEITTPYFEEDFLDYDYKALKERMKALSSKETKTSKEQEEQAILEARIVKIQSR